MPGHSVVSRPALEKEQTWSWEPMGTLTHPHPRGGSGLGALYLMGLHKQPQGASKLQMRIPGPGGRELTKVMQPGPDGTS